MNLSGSPIDFILAFAGGIFACLTPCIYPLIPITAGFISINSSGSKLKGFILSFIYVTGMAITYSCLGLVASLTGKIFGTVSSHPLTYFIVGIIVFLFGVSMLDVFPLSIPQFFKMPAVKKGSYLSTFFLGVTSGLVVGPCLTPVLGSILAYLVTRKNILYGMTLLLTFAYGMGLILILVGTFSGLVLGLPKQGQWMVYVKRICAFLLIITGAYFIVLGIRRM
jgi:thiol:disulfide interchange protein DsbD